MGALANQLALEFGQRGKQIKHESALGRGLVNGIGEGHQAHAHLLQVAHYLEQVAQRAPEPVEPVKLVDVDRIAGTQLREQPLQLGAAGARAGHLFLVDGFATGLVQGIELEFQILVTGRDAGVADFHEVSSLSVTKIPFSIL
ncbi:hypothetical protein GCM10027422_48740 [Hymenobacter arcticus]